MADDLRSQLQAALLRIPVSESERDRLWDAFATATSPSDLSARVLDTLKRKPNDPVYQKATSELQTLAGSSIFPRATVAPMMAPPESTFSRLVTQPIMKAANVIGGESVFNLPARVGFTPSGLDTNEMRKRAQTELDRVAAQTIQEQRPPVNDYWWNPNPYMTLGEQAKVFGMYAVPAAVDIATNPIELAARATGFGAAIDATRAARGLRAAQTALDAGDVARATTQATRAAQAGARAQQFAQAATGTNRAAAGLGVATGAALTAEGVQAGDLGQIGQGLAVGAMSGAGAAAQSRYGTMPIQRVPKAVAKDAVIAMRDTVRRTQQILGTRQSPENIVRQFSVFQALTPSAASGNEVRQGDFALGQAVIADGLRALQADGKLPDLTTYNLAEDNFAVAVNAAEAGIDRIYGVMEEAGTIAAKNLQDTIEAADKASFLYRNGQMPEAEYRGFVDALNKARAVTVVQPQRNRIRQSIAGLYGDRPQSRAAAMRFLTEVINGKTDLPPGILDAQLPNDTVRYIRALNVDRKRYLTTRPTDQRVDELTDPMIGVYNAIESELRTRLVTQLEKMGVGEASKLAEAVAITTKMRNRMRENQESLQSDASGIPLTTPERLLRTAMQTAAGAGAVLAAEPFGGVGVGVGAGGAAALTSGRLFAAGREFYRQGKAQYSRNAEMQRFLRNIFDLQEPAAYSTPRGMDTPQSPEFPDVRTWPSPKQLPSVAGEVVDAERIYPGEVDPFAPKQIGTTPDPLQIPRRSSAGIGPQQGPTVDPRTGQPAVIELATPEQYVAQNTAMPRQMRQQLTQEILAQLPADVEIVMTAGPDGEMVGSVALRPVGGDPSVVTEPLATINQGVRQGAIPAPSPDYTITTTRNANGAIRSADVRSTQTNQVVRRFVGPDAYGKAEAFVTTKDTRRRDSRLALEYVDDATLLRLARPGAVTTPPPEGMAPASGTVEAVSGETVVSSDAPFASASAPSSQPTAPPLSVSEATAPPSQPIPEPSPTARPSAAPSAATEPTVADTDMFGNPIAAPMEPVPYGAVSLSPESMQAAEQAGAIINDYPLSELQLDPVNLQYKIGSGQGGQTGSLAGVKRYDKLLGGVLLVWRNPSNGKVYVVNGHNRYSKAVELGQTSHAVRFVNAPTVKDARAIGAMMNIAEGRGTVLDAAKFFRDSGVQTIDELQALGMPLPESKVTDGFYLSRLHAELFDRVTQGTMPVGVASDIGRILPAKNDQLALVKLLDQQKRALPQDVIRELAEQAAGVARVTETQTDLFGSNEMSRSLMVEEAKITAAINRRLTNDKRLFGRVGKESAAAKLTEAGNVISTAENARRAEEAAFIQDVFNRLKTSQFRPVLGRAAERLYEGGSIEAIVNDIYPEIVQGVSQAFKGRN